MHVIFLNFCTSQVLALKRCIDQRGLFCQSERIIRGLRRPKVIVVVMVWNTIISISDNRETHIPLLTVVNYTRLLSIIVACC